MQLLLHYVLKPWHFPLTRFIQFFIEMQIAEVNVTSFWTRWCCLYFPCRLAASLPNPTNMLLMTQGNSVYVVYPSLPRTALLPTPPAASLVILFFGHLFCSAAYQLVMNKRCWVTSSEEAQLCARHLHKNLFVNSISASNRCFSITGLSG